MRKKDELSDPKSCWNKAHDYERLFIVLDRDLAMPGTIRHWIQERIALGLNKPGDEQLLEADRLANEIELDQRKPKERIADFTSKGKF